MNFEEREETLEELERESNAEESGRTRGRRVETRERERRRRRERGGREGENEELWISSFWNPGFYSESRSVTRQDSARNYSGCHLFFERRSYLFALVGYRNRRFY